MAGLTKAQKAAREAEAQAKAAEDAANEALRLKSIELSQLDAAAFDALSDEERQKWIDSAQTEIDAAAELANAEQKAKEAEIVDLEKGKQEAAQAAADKADLEAKAAEAEKAKSKQSLPESVTLASPYGYDPEIEGQPQKFWAAGQVVTDQDEIKDLLDRQAPLLEE